MNALLLHKLPATSKTRFTFETSNQTPNQSFSSRLTMKFYVEKRKKPVVPQGIEG